MAYSYFETTVSALESAKRTVGGVDYYDLSYTTLDYTPLFSTTQLEADKYVSNVGDTLQVTLGVNTLDRSSNTDLWTVDTTNSRVTINTGDTSWSTLNPQNSDLVRLTRVSKKDAPYVDYANAAVLTEQDLDAQAKQSLHIVQESIDIANDGLTKDTDGKWNAGTKVIKNVATPSSSDPSDYVATKGYVDGTSASTTVASISDEITTVAGVSNDVTVVAGVVKETIAYTVDVANSVFRIQGGEFSSATEKPALNLQRGSTYTFNYTHSSIASGSHVLGFSSTNSNTAFSGATAYTTGITNDTTSKIITFVVPSSAPSTLYYYCTNSSHNAMGNTINVAEDSIEVVADNIANVNLLGPKATEIGNLGTSTNVTNMTNLNASGVIANIGTVANSTYQGQIQTLANSTYQDQIETLAETNYKGKVETVAGSDTAINNIYNNLNSINNFGDTYHTAGSSTPTGSNVTTGDLWFDTSANTMKVYNGSSWASASSSIDAVASITEYTGSQATNNKWFALTHDVGLQIVWLNGIRQVQGSDYYSVNSNSSTTNMTSGASTHIYFISNVASTDVISAMAFGQIDSTAVVAKSGGTFTGGVTFEGQNTHNTGSNTFTMPTTRGENDYVLTRDNSIGTGGTAWKQTVFTPNISSLTYPDGDDGTAQTALESGTGSGTETLIINGGNFTATVTSVTITVNGATSALGGSFVRGSSSLITVSTIVKRNAGTYTITVTNDTGQLATTTVIFSGTPSFNLTGQTAGSLGSIITGSTLNKTITTAGGDGTITLKAGTPNKPTWMTVGGTGSGGTSWTDVTGSAGLTTVLAGTTANSGTAETFTFGIIVRDAQNQGSDQDFSLTVADHPLLGGSGANSSADYTLNSINYRVKRFTGGSSTMEFYAPTLVDILVVGGGGGGASEHSGGGGGGGVLYNATSGLASSSTSSMTVPAGTYTIAVGTAGGGTSASGGQDGGDGGNSSVTYSGSGTFATMTAGGGGGGTSHNNGAGGAGLATNGNAGGGGSDTGAGGTANGDGKDGGSAAAHITGGGGGGGGGAGVAGNNASVSGVANSGGKSATSYTNGGGNGGNGIQVGAIYDGTNNYHWGGGGGGGAIQGVVNSAGNGGLGGGAGGGLAQASNGDRGGGGGSALNAGGEGTASNSSSGAPGGAGGTNTGGGGGASGSNNSAGGAGGSGIVIIRYVI